MRTYKERVEALPNGVSNMESAGCRDFILGFHAARAAGCAIAAEADAQVEREATARRAAQSENVDLKGENLRLQTKLDQAKGAVALLKAENESLRKHAERLDFVEKNDLAAANQARPVAGDASSTTVKSSIGAGSGPVEGDSSTSISSAPEATAQAGRANAEQPEPLPVEVLKAWATLRHTPWPFSPNNVRQVHTLCAWVQSAHGITDKRTTPPASGQEGGEA